MRRGDCQARPCLTLPALRRRLGCSRPHGGGQSNPALQTGRAHEAMSALADRGLEWGRLLHRQRHRQCGASSRDCRMPAAAGMVGYLFLNVAPGRGWMCSCSCACLEQPLVQTSETPTHTLVPHTRGQPPGGGADDSCRSRAPGRGQSAAHMRVEAAWTARHNAFGSSTAPQCCGCLGREGPPWRNSGGWSTVPPRRRWRPSNLVCVLPRVLPAPRILAKNNKHVMSPASGH